MKHTDDCLVSAAHLVEVRWDICGVGCETCVDV